VLGRRKPGGFNRVEAKTLNKPGMYCVLGGVSLSTVRGRNKGVNGTPTSGKWVSETMGLSGVPRNILKGKGSMWEGSSVTKEKKKTRKLQKNCGEMTNSRQKIGGIEGPILPSQKRELSGRAENFSKK